MTLDDLIKSKGMKPADVARRARLSERTIYNARQGGMPNASTLFLVATVLQVDESDVRSAIEQSKEGSEK